MSDVITLPRLGETMEEGRVVLWLKKPGDTFRRGETLVEIETDKTVVELPAVSDGWLGEIIAAEGTQVAVGSPLCRTRGRDTKAGPASGIVAGQDVAAETDPLLSPDWTSPQRAFGERRRATPLARSLARGANISLDDCLGTGRRGRIEADDVRLAIRLSGGAPTRESLRDPAPSAGGMCSLDGPGGRIAYRDWQPEADPRGTAVLLHGFGGDHQVWSALASLLARSGLRAVAPDLPGHGGSSVEASRLEDLAKPLESLLDQRVSCPVDLIAHSVGAVAACGLVRLRPMMVRSLTLVAPAGLGIEIDGDFIHGMAGVSNGGALAHLLRRLAIAPPPFSNRRLDAMAAGLGGTGRLRALAAAFAADNRQQIDIRRDLDAITIPLRIIWGLDDAIIPWRHALNAPSRAACHFIRSAGHMPQWDQPVELATILTGESGWSGA